MGFLRQEHRNGLSFPFPGDLPDLGIKPGSPTLAGRFFIAEPSGKKTSIIPLLLIEGRRRRRQEDEKVGWHHRFNGHGFEQTPGESEGREDWGAAVHGIAKSWT